MHGMGMGHHWGLYRRGPSRLLWFIIGAGAATWWIKKRDGHFGHCGPRPIDTALPQSSPSTDNGYAHNWHQRWHAHMNEAQRSMPTPPQVPADVPAEKTPVDFTPPPQVQYQAAPSYPQQQQQPQVNAAWGWDHEREHIERISKQATDAMVDLTESTLESVLATAESLKAKLAEQRAQREKQQKLIDRQLEEQRKNPPRLV
ncbi:hypothetical protein CPB83DRAFT_892645 [Crepidotus variabilis]|uniref:Uncharacterized protein n=1 Tax=Crepidotus variabilis TaxID=179855 RepID=A0A9P6JRK4_9AGAR|nr:hypothetical protein CPB83DRAFT_892645 [Crepidotus variabilis]